MLAQYVTLSETGLVPIAAHHSFEDAASLPCAAVTAWHGLVSRGRLQAGDNVLLGQPLTFTKDNIDQFDF